MGDFKPEIMREDITPSFAMQCQRCELSKQRKRVVWGEGDPDAPVFILLDNPGLREDREGNSFVCGTRETLQIGLMQSGLTLDRVYVSYLLKCRPVRAYNKPLARDACFSHLQLQWTNRKPEILLGLGNTVVQHLFPNEEADVKSFRGKWHTFQDIPITFSYHPLAVRRRPTLMKHFIADITLVAQKMGERV